MDMPPTFPCDAAKEGSRAFEPFLQAMPMACVVMTPQMIIVSANPAYLRLAGRSAAEILGRNIFDAFPSNPHDPHADGAVNLRASLLRVCATGRADKMELQRYDVATQENGSDFQTRYWKIQNMPVPDADGAVAWIMHTVEELTDFYLPRKNTLRDVLANLAEALRDLKGEGEIGHAASAILGQALGASRVGYGTLNQAADTLGVERDWCAPGIDTLAGSTALRGYGALVDELRREKFIAIANVDHDPRTAPLAAHLRARDAAAFVYVPVVEDGALVAVLFVNDRRERHWTAEELVLVKEVAARIRIAAERARGAATRALRGRPVARAAVAPLGEARRSSPRRARARSEPRRAT